MKFAHYNRAVLLPLDYGGMIILYLLIYIHYEGF